MGCMITCPTESFLTSARDDVYTIRVGRGP